MEYPFDRTESVSAYLLRTPWIATSVNVNGGAMERRWKIFKVLKSQH
jgi:hypothetical protein